MRPTPRPCAALWLACAACAAATDLAGRLQRTSAGAEAVAVDAPLRELRPSRRLFGFQWPSGVPDPNKLKDEAGKFVDNAKTEAGKVSGSVGRTVGDAADKAKDAAQASFGYIKDTFSSATTLVEEGLSVVSTAVDTSARFSAEMTLLFKDFEPLQPIFGATHGIVPLLTSERNMKHLINFLVDLLESATELADVGTAVGTVSTIFGQLFDLFSQELSRLNGVVSGRRLLVDYTSLLGGLDFEALKVTFQDFSDRASAYVNQVKAINQTLSPLLRKLQQHLSSGRRLTEKDALAELKSQQLKYEGAILSVVPTWQSVEGLAIEICGQTDGALREVTSLRCRVQGFAGSVQLPGTSGIQNIVDDCEQKAVKESQSHAVECPAVAQSAGVRDMLSDSAGALGWTAVTFEYMIRNSIAMKVLCAILCFVIGVAWAFFGYRFKDCELWLEGFVAGLLVWSIVVSVVIVFFGVCRGTVIDSCEPPWLLLIVGLLSVGCAVTTVKAQRVQLFLAGFDLGAVLGSFLYIVEFHQQIFHTFVAVDDQQAKVIMAGFLGSALVVGLMLGTLTVFFEKPVIVCGTAGIGGFIMTVGVSLVLPHSLGWADLAGWCSLTVLAAVVQYRCTAPSSGQTSKDEEVAPLVNGA